MAEPNDLYGLALDQFVSERAAVAKSFRSEGRRDEAARVAKLAKPSVAAWAVNQLIRTQGSAVSDLFDAGDALIEAQSAVVEGRGDSRALREASRREREAVDVLSAAARGLLGSAGNEMSPATLDRVSETLHAAALDADARAQVQDGCLVRELKHVGLGGGMLGGLAAPVAPGPGAERSRPRGAKPAKGAKDANVDAKTRAAERAALRERAAQVKAAEKAEAAARREAERAARDVSAAAERRDRAAAVLAETEEALASAQDRAQATRRKHAEAVRAVEALRRDEV
jgi:hypothetical protein